MTAAGSDRDASRAQAMTRVELDALSAQLRALTDAVDRLTDRMDSVVAAVAGAPADVEPRDDPYAWPSDEDIARYRAGRTLGDSF